MLLKKKKEKHVAVSVFSMAEKNQGGGAGDIQVTTFTDVSQFNKIFNESLSMIMFRFRTFYIHCSQY